MKKKSVSDDFGIRMRDLRVQLGFGQKDFAETLGITGSFLSEIENGRSKFSFELATKLASIYNVNLDWLFMGRGSRFFNEQSIDDASLGDKNLRIFFQYIVASPFFKYDLLSWFTRYKIDHKAEMEEALGKQKNTGVTG